MNSSLRKLLSLFLSVADGESGQQQSGRECMQYFCRWQRRHQLFFFLLLRVVCALFFFVFPFFVVLFHLPVDVFGD